eukprot:CAMPEP_0184442478 /NCGR_PEP_ID=MMETSP0738-20130409/756611_1 /TAXON_ID=385413 /ORGANISM="Thalassiosira miniscula, Strain CCMP1093" /LENGTH=32 /DNA_ID= /DNA_START= /DNA_END= /DNA_ORIENTATION=
MTKKPFNHLLYPSGILHAFYIRELEEKEIYSG